MNNLGFRIFPPTRAPEKLVELFRGLPTPNISDNMNRLNGVSGEIRAMHGPEQLLGSAFTVRTRPGDNLLVHKALDMLEPGDALVIDAGGETTNAILGEIIMQMAIGRGAAGIVVDGAIRDTDAFAEARFPCFARGSSHRGPYKDGPGEINVPAVVGGAIVNPGDIVVGDSDGIVFVPQEVAEELAQRVRETNAKEEETMRQISAGSLDRGWVDRTLEQRGCQWVGPGGRA
ncbi:RraA family protein [Rubrobacter taiwanensis]|uniref:Putative 4-hydroxy-4-methyl-2-oxoglutarate aldolase n=1 Tax=Rubrobacter taiwanensis TaxID=185139 RepID=A0A4R1BTW9_9ACTN|nr:RraA family protein [Rubrobacter taiwanensis]TCJ20736.1 RraA family protein [Rubrobacter taiwanensis]